MSAAAGYQKKITTAEKGVDRNVENDDLGSASFVRNN
jgi:hypothetical protein